MSCKIVWFHIVVEKIDSIFLIVVASKATPQFSQWSKERASFSLLTQRVPSEAKSGKRVIDNYIYICMIKGDCSPTP